MYKLVTVFKYENSIFVELCFFRITVELLFLKKNTLKLNGNVMEMGDQKHYVSQVFITQIHWLFRKKIPTLMSLRRSEGFQTWTIYHAHSDQVW